MYQYNNVAVYQSLGSAKFNCYTDKLLDCYIVYFFLKNKLYVYRINRRYVTKYR